MECIVDNTGANRRFIIRLDKDEMVLESLEQIISDQKISNGVLTSGIGTLSDARIHMVTTVGYPAVEVYPEWKDVAIELSSISGIIADGKPHFHVVFSDAKGTYSGHLEHGCKTLYLCEIVIEELGVQLDRIKDSNNIYKLTEKRG